MTTWNYEELYCVSCEGELNYDVKLEALDGASIENGYSLRVAVVCTDCGVTATPTEKMREAMANLATHFIPADATVISGKAEA